MADKIVVTPEMVRAAQDGAYPLSGEWAKRFAENLTKVLNPGPWKAQSAQVTRKEGDEVSLAIYTSYEDRGTDNEVRNRMAKALADILNEVDFKREDYA